MKNRVQQLRRRQGWTQGQLGEKVGVSRQTISAIEAGRYEPSIWLAYDIAVVFGRAIEDVFLFEDSQRKSRAAASRGKREEAAAYGA